MEYIFQSIFTDYEEGIQNKNVAFDVMWVKQNLKELINAAVKCYDGNQQLKCEFNVEIFEMNFRLDG